MKITYAILVLLSFAGCGDSRPSYVLDWEGDLPLYSETDDELQEEYLSGRTAYWRSEGEDDNPFLKLNSAGEFEEEIKIERRETMAIAWRLGLQAANDFCAFAVDAGRSKSDCASKDLAKIEVGYQRLIERMNR